MKQLLCLVAAVLLMGCDSGQVSRNANPSSKTQSGNSSGVSVSQARAIINQHRARSGAAPLVYSGALQAVAQRHATDMARGGFFSHTGSDGRRLRERLYAAGYGFCAAAENVAYGADTTAGVLAQWRATSAHNRNMINPTYRAFGLARSAGNRWVMVLATPRGRC